MYTLDLALPAPHSRDVYTASSSRLNRIVTIWPDTAESTVLPAQQTLLITDPERDRFRLITQSPLATTGILIVASTQPIIDALKGLQAIANNRGLWNGLIPVTAPETTIKKLLNNIRATRRQPITPRYGQSAWLNLQPCQSLLT